MPRVVADSGSTTSQATVGTTIDANVAPNLVLVTDLGMSGTSDTTWSPLASARLVAQWPRAGVETSVLRGAADTPLAPSRDREAIQVQVQPLSGFTLAALTSLSRPAADPDAPDTTAGTLRVAYNGAPTGQLVAIRQWELTALRATDITSLEWRQRGPGQMAVRYVLRQDSGSALNSASDGSQVEVDLPALAPRRKGLDLRATLTAGASQPTDPEMKSRVSCRVALPETAVLTGETEFGLSGRDAQVLRALRMTTDLRVVATTRLQLSYSYIGNVPGALQPPGQMFAARISRRFRLGW